MLDRNILLTVGQWKCLRRHTNVVHPAEESSTKVYGGALLPDKKATRTDCLAFHRGGALCCAA
jgi:hypothetical protein